MDTINSQKRTMKTDTLKFFLISSISGLFPWAAISLLMCFNRYHEMGDFFFPFGIFAWGIFGITSNILSALAISILFSPEKRRHLWWIIISISVYALVAYKLLY